jgi:hypothetical protein
VREDALAGEAPDDDHAGEALDGRVQAEADERDRARRDAGRDGHRALDRHPASESHDSSFARPASAS